MPSSCAVRDPKHILASYKSGTARELKHIIGKDNPGVAQYNLTDHLSLGAHKIQGGAPNNFLILTKNIDPTIRKVETKVNARL